MVRPCRWLGTLSLTKPIVLSIPRCCTPSSHHRRCIISRRAFSFLYPPPAPSPPPMGRQRSAGGAGGGLSGAGPRPFAAAAAARRRGTVAGARHASEQRVRSRWRPFLAAIRPLHRSALDHAGHKTPERHTPRVAGVCE